MVRALLAVGALLAVSVGCRDGPTAVTVPSEIVSPVAPTLVAAEVAATMRDLLDDAFVRDLIAVADAGSVGRPIRRSLQDVMNRVSVGEPQAILRSLTSAQGVLHDVTEAADEYEIERAALGLILDDVQAALDAEAPKDARQDKHDLIHEREQRSRR